MKSLRVTFSNGEMYDIPIEIIAKERASYYAEHDTKTKCGHEFDIIYKKEYDYTMKDKGELTDWAFNNMDWVDVKAHANIVRPNQATPNYNKEWTNVKHKIV